MYQPNRTHRFLSLVTSVLITICLFISSTVIATTANSSDSPISFTPNHGQWDERVMFHSQSDGALIWFTTDGIYYQFIRSTDTTPPTSTMMKNLDRPPEQEEQFETLVIQTSFVNANPSPKINGQHITEHKNNYFYGSDQSQWLTDVPNYKSVTYEQVYDGIDVVYYGKGTQIEYDLVVAPGVDYSQIEIEYEGAESMSIDTEGRLIIQTAWNDIIEQKPIIFQNINNTRVPIDGNYKITGEKTFSFDVPTYEKSIPLVIDPVLEYGTILGGVSGESGKDIKVDADGNIFVSGYTFTVDFPLYKPYQGTYHGNRDIFVTKFDPATNAIHHSTYIGGSYSESSTSMALLDDGSLCLTGWTSSTDFPILNAIQPTYQGQWETFLLKMSPAGNTLLFSTYLGGSADDWSTGLEVDNTDNMIVIGNTTSTDFPISSAFQNSNIGGYDVFVTKVTAAGDAVMFSTYLGGSTSDEAADLVLDDNGDIYLAGITNSVNFPTVNPYQSTMLYQDAFVAQLSADGQQLLYSTYLGGSDIEVSGDIALDSENNIIVVGGTQSIDFPTQNAYQDTKLASTYCTFVTKLHPDSSDLLYSTHLSGSSWGQAFAVYIDSSDCAIVGGVTASDDFPLRYPNQSYSYFEDCYLSKLNKYGNDLTFSTFITGIWFYDAVHAITMKENNKVYVTGVTDSDDFPLRSYLMPWQNGDDCFVQIFSVEIDYDSDTYITEDDCDDFDGTVYPGAPEILDDGIDQNCDGVDATCCINMRGNANNDLFQYYDISDLLFLVDYFFATPPGPTPVCIPEADVNASGQLDISDLLYMVDSFFADPPGPLPVWCG